MVIGIDAIESGALADVVVDVHGIGALDDAHHAAEIAERSSVRRQQSRGENHGKAIQQTTFDAAAVLRAVRAIHAIDVVVGRRLVPRGEIGPGLPPEVPCRSAARYSRFLLILSFCFRGKAGILPSGGSMIIDVRRPTSVGLSPNQCSLYARATSFSVPRMSFPLISRLSRPGSSRVQGDRVEPSCIRHRS